MPKDEELKDPFVVAVRKICQDAESRFFLEWLLQSKISALTELAEAENDMQMQKLSGAASAYTYITDLVANAMRINNCKIPLCVNLNNYQTLKLEIKDNI